MSLSFFLFCFVLSFFLSLFAMLQFLSLLFLLLPAHHRVGSAMITVVSSHSTGITRINVWLAFFLCGLRRLNCPLTHCYSMLYTFEIIENEAHLHRHTHRQTHLHVVYVRKRLKSPLSHTLILILILMLSVCLSAFL